MANLPKLWAGRVYGTNTGNLFIEFTKTEPALVGVLRFMDNNFGPTVYEVTGTYKDNKLEISGIPKQSTEGVLIGNLNAEGELDAEGNLKGKWETVIGSGGTFAAFPHADTPSEPRTDLPEQIHTRYIQLGSIQLFLADINALFELIKRDFTTGRLVVVYRKKNGKSEISDYADAFLKKTDLKCLIYLKITIQEPEAYGINRSIVIELRAHGSNDIRVQGVQESWVIGKSEVIAEFLKTYQAPFTTVYKRLSPTFNQIIFFFLLVFIPTVNDTIPRAIFTTLALFLLTLVNIIQSKYIPNASISMVEKSPNWLERNWLMAASWLMKIIATIVGGLLLVWIKHYFNQPTQ